MNAGNTPNDAAGGSSYSGMSRRTWLKQLSIGAVATGLGAKLPGAVPKAVKNPAAFLQATEEVDPGLGELNYEMLYEARFELDPFQMIETPNGLRMIALVTNGWMTSPKFGVTEVLPGSGDWARTRNDGVIEIDVRATLRLDDDSLVHMTYGGVSVVPPTVFERIMGGEEVDPGEYYFRVTPRFQTGSEQYGWLNNVVCVANGKAGPGLQWVEYVGFQIL